MDYKKKYKEEVVRATQLWECGDITRENLEYIFPELKESEDDRKSNGGIVFEDFNEGDGFYKVNLAYLSKEQVEEIENIVKKWNPEPEESEDEKIRKAIHIYLDWLDGRKDYAPRGEYTIRDMIAWLEKQCEQTDINPSEFDIRLNKLLKQFETLPKEELASSLSFYLNVVQNDGTYKADEKQGVQKPANKVESKFHEGDWVVQENIGVYKVIEVCESWYEVVDNKDKHYSIGFDKEYMFHLYTIQDANDGDVLATGDWVFIFERLNTNDKPVCYCHYDVELGFAIDVNTYVSTVSTIKPATKEQRDTLEKAMANAGYTFDFEKKELKKIEQKPAEWSEEDERMWKSALWHIKNSCSNGGKNSGEFEVYNWLKSLRPQKQWKPTGAQLASLTIGL